MILQALVEYYEALERKEKITSPGWCRARVAYGLDISEPVSYTHLDVYKRQCIDSGHPGPRSRPARIHQSIPLPVEQGLPPYYGLYPKDISRTGPLFLMGKPAWNPSGKDTCLLYTSRCV